MKLRKGFTLVELLIVIVIIGILAAAMLLSSGSATAAAEASNIVSDLRSMKAAALMFYADSMDSLPGLSTLRLTHLQPYMDNPAKFTQSNGYIFGGTSSPYSWWVGFDLTTGKKSAEVAKKLAARAKSVGVYNKMSNATTDEFKGTDTKAYMIAR